jgi:hypothetical protein
MATGYYDNGAPLADSTYNDAALAMQTRFPFQDLIDWPQIYNSKPFLRGMFYDGSMVEDIGGHQFGWRPPLFEQKSSRMITPTQSNVFEAKNIMGDFRATWRLEGTEYTITYDQLKETQGEEGRVFNLSKMYRQGAIEDHKNLLEEQFAGFTADSDPNAAVNFHGLRYSIVGATTAQLTSYLAGTGFGNPAGGTTASVTAGSDFQGQTGNENGTAFLSGDAWGNTSTYGQSRLNAQYIRHRNLIGVWNGGSAKEFTMNDRQVIQHTLEKINWNLEDEQDIEENFKSGRYEIITTTAMKGYLNQFVTTFQGDWKNDIGLRMGKVAICGVPVRASQVWDADATYAANKPMMFVDHKAAFFGVAEGEKMRETQLRSLWPVKDRVLGALVYTKGQVVNINPRACALINYPVADVG